MNQSFKDIPGIIDRISDAVVALDSNWCYTYMNKKAGEIFNRDPATMIGKHIWTEFPEDIDQPIYKAYHKAITEQRYIYLEEYYPRYDRWFENHIYPAPEGLSIFFRDITEKKKADEAVKASEKQLDLIYNTIEDVVFLIAVEKEKRFRFQAVNRSFLSVTGLKQEQVLGKYVEEVIPEPSLSLVLSKYKETIQTRQTSRWEEISEFPAGRKTGIVSVTPVFNDTGECVTLVGTVHDITQIKTIEEKLVKANRLYDFLSQINQMIVHTTDAEMLFKKACEISVDIGKFRMAWIGIIDEEMQKVIPVMHAGEDRDYLSKIRNISVNDSAEGRGPTGTAIREGRCIYCNDIEKDPAMAPWKEAALGRGYLSSISLPIKKFGKVIGTYTLYASTINFFNEDEIELLEEAAGDISFALEGFEKETLRKKAEEAVLESERRYQTLAEMSPVGIFHTDASGNTIYVNPRWCQISGLSREEALGDGWLNAVHEEDKKYLIEKWKKATKIQQLSLSEYRFVRPDGTIAWVMGQATPEINSENQIVGYIGTTTNISERKKAEEEIARIYKEKETVLNRINDGVVSVDNEWRYTFINDAALITHPLGREETIGKVIWDVHPEMKGTIFWDKYHEAMETKKTVEVESYYAPMNIWFSVKVYPSDDGLTIFYSNITDRKKAEETLNQNRVFIESIINASPDIVYIYDIEERKNVYINEGIQQNLYYSNEEIRQMGDKVLPILMHQDDFNSYLQDTYPKYETLKDKEIIIHEYRMCDKKGDWHWLYCKESIFLRKQNGDPKQIFGIASDITVKKKIENEILKEKQLSESIIKSLPGIFYLYDQNGKFIRWNENFKTISGYSSEEISNMHPLDFFDEDEKELLSQKIKNVFISGEDTVQANFLTKKKKKIPYYFTGIVVEYEGSPCLMGVGIDFSELVKAQEKIKETTNQLRQLTGHLQNIREEERKRIGREIHDDLGQQLTAIKMDVAWIDKKTPSESELIKTKLKNIITLLDSSNQSVRRILNELRPGILDEYGLLEALKWQGHLFTQTAGIPIVFKIPEIEFKLETEIANCIYRVYQESLTNIMRYAKAKKVFVSLHTIKDSIHLSIKDNGKGFDNRKTQAGRKTFGILGMKERVLALNGVFELTSTPAKGTEIKISLPFRE